MRTAAYTMLFLALGLTLITSANRAGGSDVVELVSGERLEGRVLLEQDTHVVVLVDGEERRLERAEVARVVSVEGHLHQFLRFHDVLDPNNAGSLIDLARFSSARGLEGLARLCWLDLLLHDSENAQAWEALAGWKADPSFGPRGFGRRFGLASLRRRRGLWDNAWRLETPHYTLRTNLDLPQALAAAFDLERFYAFFHEHLGTALGLYHAEGRLRAELHADRTSFPSAGTKIARDAWYDSGENTLYVLATRGVVPQAFLFHEATHQLIANGFQFSRGRGGAMPAWADEGLAEYFGVSVQGQPGRTHFRAGTRHDFHFVLHAEAHVPIRLGALLGRGRDAFLSGAEVEQTYAQAYTLVHYLMHGAAGALGEGFLGFLRGARRGLGAATHLYRQLGVKQRPLEQEWHAYARRIASGR